MISQWKRGGAFFCIESNNLKEALVRVSSKTDACKYKNEYFVIKLAVFSLFYLFMIRVQ